MRASRVRPRACLVAFMVTAAGVASGAPPSAPPPSAGNPVADAAFVREVYAGWYVPRSADFVRQSQGLVQALQRLCEAGSGTPADEAARAQWLQAVGSWERFSAVRGGALLARHSPREIDFTPARPEAIRRAIEAAPRDAAALDRIGSPAKGLPALEWLLWSQPLSGDAAACGYAQRVAEAVVTEAEALHAAYQRTLSQGWDAKASEYAMYEFLNLWDAGLQKLWWEEIDRPLKKAQDGRPPVLSRALSGHTVAGWRAQWKALRALAVGDDAGHGPSLRARLAGDGRGAEADRLAERVAAVDRATAALVTVDGAADTVAALKDLQQFAETDLAAALHFIVSFFDEDGD